ncbi:hypothetical protein I316_06875 [Kwoniella heveanensis BCC8398]|uniref:Uncharacterized protein n=1 Tax=Kwoniella heveanensis BCC8398 TaxID=1296120 RepID=A0A1B9GKJ4_9TREE|nr:hypothetical protein I316_06875 [Kwoniella heveanensis BCC8398]
MSSESAMLLLERGLLNPDSPSTQTTLSLSKGPPPPSLLPLTLDSTSLPPYQTLLSYVHRPTAVLPCFVSDVYQAKTIIQATYLETTKNGFGIGGSGHGYGTREMFLLNAIPCKFVEIVAWVAGVDHKESTMTVTLDDGDGMHVLPILIRLPHVPIPLPAAPSPKKRKNGSSHSSSRTSRRTDDSTHTNATTDTTTSSTSASTSLRGATSTSKWQYYSAGSASSATSNHKVFEYKDIRVGDTLRVVGKVDEWFRKKADGSGEWVRQVVVDENAGGSVAIVDPDEQYAHTAEVMHLHQTTYTQPFVMPDLSARVPQHANGIANSNAPASAHALAATVGHSTGDGVGHRSLPATTYEDVLGESLSAGFEDGQSTNLYSEPPSELTVMESEIELRDPSKLRSSQLTDRTFRQYMIDHMTQETVRTIRLISEYAAATAAGAGAEAGALRLALESIFPEYKDVNERNGVSMGMKGKGKDKVGSSSATAHKRGTDRIGSERGVFTPSKRTNSVRLDQQDDHPTPTQASYASRRSALRNNDSTSASTSPAALKSHQQPRIQAFTIFALLLDERLNLLARLVVENEARKEDRRRRRRIRDGSATKKDLAVEKDSKISTSSGSSLGKTTSSSSSRSSKKTGEGVDLPLLDEKETRKKMERLAAWAIRAIAEEGSLIQVKTSPDYDYPAKVSNDDQENSQSLPSVSSLRNGTDRSRNRNKEQYGYLPVPPELLFPLLIPHLEAEKYKRDHSFRPRGDPQTGNGMTVDEIVAKMRRWGDEGRWERLGDWTVEEAVEWGAERGLLRRDGRGWWVA